jgi:hypothetical protein
MLRRVISDLKKFQEDYDRQLWNSDTISLWKKSFSTDS